MKLSVNWLKQFLPDLDNDEVDPIAEKMSISLTEVEGLYDIAKDLELVVAGEILEIVNHPKNDNLKVVNVKVSENDELEIICGAKNIKVGNIVPVCLAGGKAYNPKSVSDDDKIVKIEERQVGEIKSQGMLCSEKELGIGDDHMGIYILPDDTRVGEDLTKVFFDTIIEIENKALTHRPDCFSHLGIAREISVQNSLKFEPPQAAQIPIQTAEKPIFAEVKDTENCNRYSIVVISDVTVKDSPLWLKTRLQAAGMRSINNIVDITNYLMLESGQPSHAYDYDKIKDSKLVLRQAKKGEKVKTIDGIDREVQEGMLVNTDGEKIIGIAGIMGSLSSEISTTTKNIILQVENFDMFSIRRTTRELGLRTEASTRFEKGLDPNMVSEIMNKGIEMITDLAGGEIASEVIDIYSNVPDKKIINFDIGKISKLSGIEIERTRVIEIIKLLGISIINFEKTADTDNLLELEIPSFRRDLSIQEDIIEEIVRIYGYDKLPFELPTRDLKPQNKNKRFEIEKLIKRSMSASGSVEVFNYAFVGKELYSKTGIDIEDNLKLRNPLSPELEYFRDTLIPGLLNNVAFNQIRFDDIQLFELSKTALKSIDEASGLHLQPKYLSSVVAKEADKSGQLFKILKGKIELVLNSIGVTSFKFENLEGKSPFKKSSIFHPRKSALIYSGETQIGIIGYIHPKVLNNFEIELDCAAFEINFDILAELAKEITSYSPIVNLPLVKRDISFWVKNNVQVGDIIEKIKQSDILYFKESSLKDVYFDENNQKDLKSLTFEVVLQPKIDTLKDEEITQSMTQVISVIQRSFKAEIRDN